jgi:hypothetical protein
MNAVSTIVVVLALIAIVLVVNGTFNHKYQQPSAQSLALQPINMSDLNNLKGEFSSIQNNASNNAGWIVTGRWKMFQVPSDAQSNTNLTSGKLIFNASLTMASIDGLESHRHRITDFQLSNTTFHNRDVIIDGTVSLTTQGGKPVLDKNIPNIPIRIKIFNLMTIMIEMENKTVKEHFGSTPIYGKVN